MSVDRRDSAIPEASLGRWLERLERLDPTRIRPGLERITAVLERMELRRPPFRSYLIGGTNGKGSVAAYLSGLLASSGLGPVGTYTSPHLLDYRERIVVDGAPVSAGELVDALESVESARGDTELTYFEFGTAAALEAFRRAGVREAVLEVGMGGRLDAVNAVDAAAAAVVSVGLDHQRWLGEDLDTIAREKAGIFRRGVPALIGGPDPSPALLEVARTVGAEPWLYGRDFEPVGAGETWCYRGRGLQRGPFRFPDAANPPQRGNAALALAFLEALMPDSVPQSEILSRALQATRIPGRIDSRADENGEWVLDVAHNPQAASALAGWLRARPARRTLAVFGMLADKDAVAVAAQLAAQVDQWFLTTLGGARGQGAAALAARLADTISAPVLCENTAEAIEAVQRVRQPGDRILILGSFHTVAEALTSGFVPKDAGCVND